MRSTIVVLVLTFAVLGLLLGYSESFDTQTENRVNVAIVDIENRIKNAIKAMETTSELAQVKSTDYVDSINTAQMGIPVNADVEKREVARKLLLEHAEFASIFFLTPNGDIYIGEPFEQQEQLPRLNYADRDWYKGASATNDVYVSSVFMSAAIHVPAIAIAVPVHAESGDEISGYWVAIVDVSNIDSILKEFGGNESRILLVDHNGTQVADTGLHAKEANELRSFVNLQSVKRALSGESGTVAEEVDGEEMIAIFAPVKVHPHTWAIVFLKLSEDDTS
jgi:hypothetical protein